MDLNEQNTIEIKAVQRPCRRYNSISAIIGRSKNQMANTQDREAIAFQVQENVYVDAEREITFKIDLQKRQMVLS